MKVFLETQRLILRQFTEDDADLLFELDSDPDVMRYIGPPLADVVAYRQQIREKYRAYYERYPGYGIWAAIEKATGDFLGWFTLRPALDHRFAAQLDFRPEEIELGYRLRKPAWGKGYATEGSRILVDKAFTELGTVWVVATALVENVASTHVMEKVGLKKVGMAALPGYDIPAVKYVLSKEEYERARSKT
jgi:RimJ/RimL family protein N-acetyltransferase